MFDDDHEDGDDDHDYRDEDDGDYHEDLKDGGNGDDDDGGVCSQCGRDDGNPSSWKRPPTRIPPPPSRYQHPRFHPPKREREWLSCLVLSCISNNLHFEARHGSSGCRGWWRSAASSAGKDWSLVRQSLLVSACPPKPGWELHRRDSSPAPP